METVAEGIVIAENGVPYFTVARFQLHLERAQGNIKVAAHDMLAAAYRAEDQKKAVAVRGA